MDGDDMTPASLATTLLGPNYPPDALAAIEAFRLAAERRGIEAAAKATASILDDFEESYFGDSLDEAETAYCKALNECLVAIRALIPGADADHARGRTYVEWRKPMDYNRMVHIERPTIVLVLHRDGNIWRHDKSLIPDGLDVDALAWAELPAPPLWAIPSPEQVANEPVFSATKARDVFMDMPDPLHAWMGAVTRAFRHTSIPPETWAEVEAALVKATGKGSAL
jgi:hypothetical protein